MTNVLIVESTEHFAIAGSLRAFGVEGGIFTNGTYVAPATIVVPTTLAGFEYMADRYAKKDDALFILLNSDKSMQGIMDAKNAPAEERAAVEPQMARAHKVLTPLGQQHPNRKVVGLFYDEATPTALYDALAINGMDMRGLFKFGYGTNPDAPRIEGAHNFDRVTAFPFLNDAKALCHDLTVHEDQSAFVEVVRLQNETPNGRIYMTPEGKLTFRLASELAAYGVGPQIVRGADLTHRPQ